MRVAIHLSDLKQSATALGDCTRACTVNASISCVKVGCMNEQERARRPGGRSPGGAPPRVGAQVHQAVTALISERGYGNFTVGEVAARAGVADSSIYRRWGSL